MIAMLDTGQDLDVCAAELGTPVEQLLSPLTRYTPQKPGQRFAIDNGSFARFDRPSFLSLLKREEPRRHLCRFVAVPDVVGDARRTLEVFDVWRLKMKNWPLAFVCQNGQENLPIPWHQVAAVFIGGDTDWKLGKHAVGCIKAAKALGKWIHVGRVNTPGRFEFFEALGVDSIDGSGLARYSHMRENILRTATEPKLDFAL